MIETTLARLAGSRPEEAQWYAKDATARLAVAAQVGLLYKLAETAGDRYAQLATLYARRFLLGEEYPAGALKKPEVWGA